MVNEIRAIQNPVGPTVGGFSVMSVDSMNHVATQSIRYLVRELIS
jgi:hypothetical protein